MVHAAAFPIACSGTLISMFKQKFSHGVTHTLPQDVRAVLIANPKAYTTWELITPLARNEWICWVISAKKQETRDRRIQILSENLALGKRRPCCWAGCVHRG